jgi:hypothetical protein
VARCQVDDYELRDPELESMSFIHFVIDTYEERITDNSPKEPTIKGMTPRKRPGGRPANKRARYLSTHVKHQTHLRVVRSSSHNILPNIVGPFFPQRDDEDGQNIYCAMMLMLCKPWRSIEGLKDKLQTWEEAFDHFVENATPETHDILASIQYYYDSKRAANGTRTEHPVEEHQTSWDQCDNDDDSGEDESNMETSDDQVSTTVNVKIHQ